MSPRLDFADLRFRKFAKLMLKIFADMRILAECSPSTLAMTPPPHPDVQFRIAMTMTSARELSLR